MRTALVLAFLVVASFAPRARADDWGFDDEYRSPLLFLHPAADYAFNPEWTRQWEANLVRRSGVRITSGSVSTDELLTLAQVNLTEDLTHGFRFLSTYDWFEGIHLDVAFRDLFFGLEKKVAGPVSVQGMIQPTSAKEDVDAVLGVLLTDAGRGQYLRLWIRFEDFVYEEKNDVGGRSVQEPVGPQWALRGTRGRWELVSEGRYLSASVRAFPDSSLAPGTEAFSRQYGASQTRVRYVRGERSFAEAGLAHYRYRESGEGRSPGSAFSYGNEILQGTGRCLFGFAANWGGRAELHLLDQDADATGIRDYAYRRRDIMPAAFLRRFLGTDNMLELGYMGTFYDWTMDSRIPDEDYEANGYADKLKLSWTYRFTADARLRASLSHEPNLSRFGGGNLQFQMLF